VPDSPQSRGFSWPAEWERHEATWLAWPHDPTTWPDCVEDAERAFAQLAAAIGRSETVHLLVADEGIEQRARTALSEAAATNVALHRIRTEDSWFRDYGPIVVAQGEGDERTRLAVNFTFNAWGEKYPELLPDTEIPKHVQPIHRVETLDTPFVLEGGAIDGNGSGTVLTTEQCLLNPNRNPQLSREEIEERLRTFLGARNILWLGEGIVGDDTDGHVDDIARFVSPSTVVTAVEDDSADANHAPLRDNLERLRSMTDESGGALRIVELPMPEPVFSIKGHRLPASYANFYIANDVVCVPTFGTDRDELALGVLRPLFPDRDVAGIRCERLVEGLGTLHCVTQQLPY